MVDPQSELAELLKKELEHKLGEPVRQEGNALQFEVADSTKVLGELLQEVQPVAVELRSYPDNVFR